MLLAVAPLHGPVTPATHPGRPSRKSWKVLNDIFIYPLPALLASLITCCPSAPNRKLCLPCVQETWSAPSNWLLVLFSPKAVFDPKLRPPRPLIVTSERLSTPGVRSVMPNCELVLLLTVLATAITR